MLLKLDFEISMVSQFEVQFSVRVWELSQDFVDRAIQDMIATIILRLKQTKELFKRS